MINILDPRLWLAILLGGALLFAAGDFNGDHRASKAAALRDAKITAAAAIDLAQATEDAREKDRLVARSISAIATQHHQELTHAQLDRDRFIDGVRNGTIRLSIPVIADRAHPAGADSAAAAGDQRETRAEPTPAAGAALDALAYDGDEAIRQLNSCIDVYNAVRDGINNAVREPDHVQTE